MRLPEATYLAWLDCTALKLPCSAGQFFLDKARVGLNFGETFGPQYGGFARLNFATPTPVLREIVGEDGGSRQVNKPLPRERERPATGLDPWSRARSARG